MVLVDTAGRLQNRAELMGELEKIVRVIRKVEPTAPHAVLLVLDATVGQNALNQVEIFGKIAGVTGLVMTKLDGTARGGILVAIAARFGLPVHFIGVGEGVDDLAPFTARDFARAIVGTGDDHAPPKQQAQSLPQARARHRAAGAVLRRQCPLRHFRRHRGVHGGGADRARRSPMC